MVATINKNRKTFNHWMEHLLHKKQYKKLRYVQMRFNPKKFSENILKIKHTAGLFSLLSYTEQEQLLNELYQELVNNNLDWFITNSPVSALHVLANTFQIRPTKNQKAILKLRGIVFKLVYSR